MSARGPQISLIALRKLHADGLSDKDIASRLGCHKSWASAQRKKMGLRYNSNGDKRHTKLDRNKIIELHKLGKNDIEIASELECSDQTIKTIRLKLGLRNRIYKVRDYLQESENRVTINYLKAIAPFRGIDVTDPKIIEAINAHNRSIQRDMDGFRGRE